MQLKTLNQAALIIVREELAFYYWSCRTNHTRAKGRYEWGAELKNRPLQHITPAWRQRSAYSIQTIREMANAVKRFSCQIGFLRERGHFMQSAAQNPQKTSRRI